MKISKSQTWQPVSQSHSSGNCMRNRWTKVTTVKGHSQEGISFSSFFLFPYCSSSAYTHIRTAAVLQVQAYTALKDQIWPPNREWSLVRWCQMYDYKGTLHFQIEIHHLPASFLRTMEETSSPNTHSAGHSVSQVLALAWILFHNIPG